MAGEEELKNVKLPVSLWEELAKDKIDLKVNKISDAVRFWRDKAQDKKDILSENGRKVELENKLKELDSQLCAAEDRIVEMEKQLAEARAEMNMPVPMGCDVPEELNEKITDIVREKGISRDEEKSAAWNAWLRDFDFAKKNFEKLKVRGKKAGEEIGDFEMMVLGDSKVVLGSLLRHGFAKRREDGKIVLEK